MNKKVILLSLLLTQFLLSDMVIDLSNYNIEDKATNIIKAIPIKKYKKEDKGFFVLKKEKEIETKNKKLSDILYIFGKNNKESYILKGEDYLINQSLKVSNLKDIVSMIEITSSNKVDIIKTKLKNTYFVILKNDNNKNNLQIEVKANMFELKKIILKEFGLKLIMNNNILYNKNNRVHLYGDYTVDTLLEDLENQLNLWFTKKGNKVYVSETKEIIIDDKNNAIMSKNNEDYYVQLLKKDFPNIDFKKSYVGFIMAIVSPKENEILKSYLKNIEQRNEIVDTEILLLKVKNKNKYKIQDRRLINNNNINEIIKNLKEYSEVEIIDKWNISNSTGMENIFDNSQKIEHGGKYINVGFNGKFKINKTKSDNYILEGVIDYSFLSPSNVFDDHKINNKKLNLYTELKSLNKSLILGGFKDFSSSFITEGSEEYMIIIKLSKNDKNMQYEDNTWYLEEAKNKNRLKQEKKNKEFLKF